MPNSITRDSILLYKREYVVTSPLFSLELPNYITLLDWLRNFLTPKFVTRPRMLISFAWNIFSSLVILQWNEDLVIFRYLDCVKTLIVRENNIVIDCSNRVLKVFVRLHTLFILLEHFTDLFLNFNCYVQKIKKKRNVVCFSFVNCLIFMYSLNGQFFFYIYI